MAINFLKLMRKVFIPQSWKVNITEFAVGDGGGQFYSPKTEATSLKNEVWRGPVNACYISQDSENLLIVESIIPSDTGGFTIREMGLFDEEGVLIAICNTPDTQKVRVADGVVHELDLSMEIALANTGSIELIVNTNVVTAKKKDIENLYLEVKKKIENINQTMQEQIQEGLRIIGDTKKGMDSMKKDMLKMNMVVSTLKEADVMDSENTVIETFSNDNDVIMLCGKFDSKNKCLYA